MFISAMDIIHIWVSTQRGKFEAFMKYLALNQYKVIALRDIEKYVDINNPPSKPLQIIEDRKKQLAKKQSNNRQ